MAYVAAAHPATSTRHALVASLGGAGEPPVLVVARTNRLEVYRCGGTLALLHAAPVSGRIAALASFRPAAADADRLLVVTDTFECVVLAWQPAARRLERLPCAAAGSLADASLRPADSDPRIRAHARCLAVYAYHGVLALLPFSRPGRLARGGEGAGELQAPVVVRLFELRLLDLVFLRGDDDRGAPALAILYADGSPEKRRVKQYAVALADHDVADPLLLADDLDVGANTLVPLRHGALLVLGQHALTLLKDGRAQDQLLAAPTVFAAWTEIAPDVFVLADDYGALFHAAVCVSPFRVLLQPLGKFPVAAALAAIDPSHLFLASHFGDSHLLEISAAAARSLHALTNIAPVSDFCVHDSGSSKAVVTCSGGYSDGSIRVVRNGIAVEELGSVDLEGIQAVWDLHNGLLVLAFSSETRVLQSTNDELEMLPEFPGIPFNKQTIFAGTINSSLVHVTRDSVLVSRRESILAAWHPPAGLYISHADSNASVIIVATQSGSVIQFSPALQIIAEYSFSSEISCLALTPSAILLGLWTRPSIHIIPLDKSTPIAESLPSDSIPRSIAILADHLIVSLGDGKVYTFSIHANKLVGKKSLNIAQTPVKLHSIEMNGQPAIWASSDRSGIFTIQAGKITWSSTNISDSNFVSNFSGFKDSLVIVNNSGMIFATVENAQKIHVKSFPMDGLPRRIVFTGQVWVVGVVQLQVRGETGQEYQRTFVKILQDGLFNEIHSFELDQDENISCINWIKQKVFVGTGYTNPDEDESSKGRILLFEINSEQKLRLVGETGIQGTCYALEPVQNRIICAVNSFLHLYDIVDTKMFLLSTCQTSTLALSISVYRELILVGDLMKSIALYKFNPTTSKIEQIAKDYGAMWMTATFPIDETTFVGTEADGNIVLWKRDVDTTIQQQKQRLEIVADFRLGEMVNQIRGGSLNDCTSELVDVKAVYATVDGSIGIFGLIKQGWIEPLLKLQENLTKVITCISGQTHQKYRAFSNDRRTMDQSRRCVDGDLIARFLELDHSQMQLVVHGGNGCESLDLSVERVSSLVEELVRLH